MRLFLTDHEAEYRVAAPVRWHRHPGSMLHGLLKAALERVDRDVKARLLAPITPDPAPHFSLQAGLPAPAALLPILPPDGEGPRGTLPPGKRVQIRVRRLGLADPRLDQCVEDALEILHDGLIAEQIARRGARGRCIDVDASPTSDTRVSLRFLTPAHLESRDRVHCDFTFETLIKHVRRRLEAICALYGHLPEGTSRHYIEVLHPAAHEVTRAASHLRLARWPRVTTTGDGTPQAHDMTGLLGEITFKGPLGGFVPTLRAAEEIHIGKLTSMGLGRVALNVGLD